MQLLFIFKLFGIPFFSYTTLVVTGIVLALVAASVQLPRIGVPARRVGETLAWTAIPALLIGRLAHFLYHTDYYAERPLQMLSFADGGLAFVGVFVGAGVGLWFWSRRHEIAFARAANAAALPAALIATFAWLGAFVYGSQYGAASDGALALELRDAFGVILPRFPTQLLAALWSALIALALLLREIPPHNARDGRAAFSLLSYSLALLLLDFTRGDESVYILGLRLTQCLYVVLFWSAIFSIGRKYGLRLTNLQKQTKI